MKQSLPIIITGPRRMHILLMMVGIAGLGLGMVNFYHNTLNEAKDFAMIGLFVAMIAWFGYRAWSPKTKLIFSSEGIWTEVHGQKSWDDFAGVAIEKRTGRRYEKELLLLLFDIEEAPKELQYDFYDLSISPREFRKLLDGPLKGYMEL